MKATESESQTSLLAYRSRETRAILAKRSALFAALRGHLLGEDFIEVDTPMFRIWEHPLVTLGVVGNTGLHLRACTEDFTRRCACAFGKAFEIGKCFRSEHGEQSNQDVGQTHLPEFTMLELYEVDIGLAEALNRMESMLRGVVRETCGRDRITYQRKELRFDEPFRQIPVLDAVALYGNEEARRFAARHRQAPPISVVAEADRLRDILDNQVVPNIFEPTFLTYFPKSADSYPDEICGNEVQRAELIAASMEIGEVGCLQPDAQKLREHELAAYEQLYESGEARVLVEKHWDCFAELGAFSRAVAGGGIGIDRLLMLLCDTRDISEVVWYPGVMPAARPLTNRPVSLQSEVRP